MSMNTVGEIGTPHKSAIGSAAGENSGNEAATLQSVRRNALGDSLRRLMDRVMRHVGVASGRLDIAVAEQFADHRQRLSERQGTGREAVTIIP